MNKIYWAEGGAPPDNLPPGRYKVDILSTFDEHGNFVTILRYIGFV
jgi:hypothetical protein